MSVQADVLAIAKRTRLASRIVAGLTTQTKNDVLRTMALELRAKSDTLQRANAKDLAGGTKKGLSHAMLDRLALTPARIEDMCRSLDTVADLPDPVGEKLKEWTLPNGLDIKKVRVPLGVVGIIYESRPNVTSDCAGLCFKSGNAVILRGGSEAIHSNKAIATVLQRVLRDRQLPAAAVSFIQHTARAGVDYLLSLVDYVDLIIPRGGQSLTDKVTHSSKIPVVKHDKGLCHVYVDDRADLRMAEDIAFNAKTQRPGVCNAMETLLVHRKIATRFLRILGQRFREAGVVVRGDVATRNILRWAKAATAKDWSTEYLDLMVSIRIVKDIDEAVAHIRTYGSGHSDAIVTEDAARAQYFLNAVDSACVYVNASTRFTDGFQFGMGAEIGISTNKLHARGPMALEELTTYKYTVRGTGQIRQ
jgi:glutamate-5-semialdehyde dehydrogenase